MFSIAATTASAAYSVPIGKELSQEKNESTASAALIVRQQRGDGDTSDPFPAADEAHPFVRFSLDAYATRRYSEGTGNRGTHGIAVGRETRPLRHDTDINLRDFVSGVVDASDCDTQHLDRIAPAIGGITVGKELTDVSETCGAKNCIGNCMRNGVTI